MPLNREPDYQLFEYACHEGNHADPQHAERGARAGQGGASHRDAVTVARRCHAELAERHVHCARVRRRDALALSQMMREPVEGQTPDSTVLRTADGKPDLNGIWQSIGTANWNLQDHQARTGPVLELGAILAVPAGLSVVEGNEIPYQPWAAAKQKENYDNWLSTGPGGQVLPPGRAARDLHAVSRFRSCRPATTTS